MEEKSKKSQVKSEKYIEGIGRRKESVARVRIFEAKENSLLVNDKPVNDFFKTDIQRKTAMQALTDVELAKKFKVTAKVKGGGAASQAEAVRLGTSRALVKMDEELRKALKKEGFLKRDPRAKERRKFGLKKARKAAQWSKR
jgi:small subunit ribosomal protein S9